MGGYSLGVISSLAEQEGVVAPDVLLEVGAQCQTVEAAVALYKAWRRPPYVAREV
jgi:hypothetical protein